jgi:hypothetical protein
MKAVVFGRGGTRARGPAGVERRPLAELKSALAEMPEEAVVYLDVTGLSERERTRLVASTIKAAGRRVGVLDPAGRVKDVAALFHAGAVDYLGKSPGIRGLTSRRLAAVRSYSEGSVEVPAVASRSGSAPERDGGATTVGRAIPAGSDPWESIQDGREHGFAFLFIEVDDAEELKKRYEASNLASAMDTFRAFIERIVTPSAGRLWMWSRFGGLVLFPLRDGEFPAALCGLRILLSRIFYDAEESPLPGRLSFRMAVSVGATVYKPGDTGRIVSDAVNSIFHLGRRFTRPGQYLLTADAAALTPEPLRPCLVPAGTYEGRRILRMLQPLPLAGHRG